MPTFYEFFAGGGMARAGLGEGWTCLFANDLDSKKGASYRENWGSEDLSICDIAKVQTSNLPGRADLAWASFPCQDLSLAGAGAGLEGERSGVFWPFWGLMRKIARDNRAPRLIVLENVCGALTSHDGKDFVSIGVALHGAGYKFGAIVVDAIDFLPQSRPRLFIIGVGSDTPIPQTLKADAPVEAWHPDSLITAYRALPQKTSKQWIWWKLPTPSPRTVRFADLIEDKPVGVSWHTREETERIIDMMSDINLKKLHAAKLSGRRVVGAVYKRTRKTPDGRKIQRAEVRFDDVAGCLRTPAGGSSRQLILIIEAGKIRSRLLSPREAARLMGLPDSYKLPVNYNEAYHLAGDGVAVPVVRFLAHNIFESILAAADNVALNAA